MPSKSSASVFGARSMLVCRSSGSTNGSTRSNRRPSMSKAPVRKLEFRHAVRTRVPLLVGLVGPSSSGKTKSALRLASGMRSVFGGKIWGVDTEGRRMAHYADEFDFEHAEFNPPFSSLDYLGMLQTLGAANSGEGVIIIDSASHEHEGEGGMLEMQEQEITRIAGPDANYAKREACKFAAWVKPKQQRTALITWLERCNLCVIFCF